MKLNKEEIVRIVLDYQGKFDSVLDDLRKNISELKSDFSRVEAALRDSNSLNEKLTGRILTLEKQCYANNQYLRRECFEISSISDTVESKSIEATLLKTFGSTDASVDPTLAVSCQCMPRQNSAKKIIIKLNRREDI